MRTIAERLAGEAVVVQIDTEKNPQLAARFGVRGIPVMMLLQGGQAIDQLAGAQSVAAVLAWFRRRRG